MNNKEPHAVDLTYAAMASYFRAAENKGQHLTGFIVFSQESFKQDYSELSRTYEVSSENKAFQPNKGGYSIFAACLDGTDPCLRLEGYMQDEKSGKDGWKIERCYMMSDELEKAKAILKKDRAQER